LSALEVLHDAEIRAHRAAHDVVVEQAVERVALPLGSRDVTAENQLRFSGRLVDSFMEGDPEITQGPEILEMRRLIEQPGRRTAGPSLALEVILTVQEELEKRARPAFGIEVLGKLARDFHKVAAVGIGEGLIGPVAAVVIGLDRVRPVFVHREIEALDRHAPPG
jgi:hypothetical protein